MEGNRRQTGRRGAAVIFLSEVFQQKLNWVMNMIIQDQDILLGMAGVLPLVEFVPMN